MLGDKRVDVTLLLDPDSVLKGRDLSYTETHFQGNLNTTIKNVSNFDKIKKNPIVPTYPPLYYQPNNFTQQQQQQPPPSYYPGMYYPPMY